MDDEAAGRASGMPFPIDPLGPLAGITTESLGDGSFGCGAPTKVGLFAALCRLNLCGLFGGWRKVHLESVHFSAYQQRTVRLRG